MPNVYACLHMLPIRYVALAGSLEIISPRLLYSLISESLRDGDTDGARRAVSSSLAVAVVLGTVLALACQPAALGLIKLTGCAPELWAPACVYLRVRALAMPASLVAMIAQSGKASGICASMPAASFMLPTVLL